MTRPKATQLEHLWFKASSLDLFGQMFILRKVVSFDSTRRTWPPWAPDLRMAFFNIGVVESSAPELPSKSNDISRSAKSVSESAGGKVVLRIIELRVAYCVYSYSDGFSSQTTYPLKDTTGIPPGARTYRFVV